MLNFSWSFQFAAYLHYASEINVMCANHHHRPAPSDMLVMNTGSWVHALDDTFDGHATWIEHLFKELKRVRRGPTVWVGPPSFPISSREPAMTPSVTVPMSRRGRNAQHMRVLGDIQRLHANGPVMFPRRTL